MNENEKDIVGDLEGTFGEDLSGIEARPFSEQFPRGGYTLKGNNAYLTRSANSGRKQLVLNCTIAESSQGDEYIGKQYSKTWGLETEQNWEWFKRDLSALDIPHPSKPKDLLDTCKRLMNIAFDCVLQPNANENFPPNCFINKGARRLELEKEGGAGEGTTSRF